MWLEMYVFGSVYSEIILPWLAHVCFLNFFSFFFLLQVAHMTKSEMYLYDTAFIGPALLFLDQYFNSFIDEYIVLWIALVSPGSFY